MVTWILVPLLVAVLLAAIWYRRKPASPPKEAEPEVELDAGSFRCVGVDYNPDTCCGWITQLEGARLLPREARLFPLPLPECDAATCTCRYVHFTDRRVDDRRVPFSSLMTSFGRSINQERRSGRERRRNHVSQEMRLIDDVTLEIEAVKTY